MLIIESYTERNKSLKITRLRNPIVCSGLLLEQTQAYIYILGGITGNASIAESDAGNSFLIIPSVNTMIIIDKDKTRYRS
jgi:hypothetical protein